MKSLNYFFQKIAIIAILLISFFGMNLEEGKGQCPVGFTPGNVNILVGGCVINLNICYKCSPSNASASQFYINSWTPIGPCSPLPTAEQIRTAFMQQSLSNLCTIKPCCLDCCYDPPCYDDMMKVEVFIPICWELYNTGSQIIRQVCSSNPAYCSKRFAVCVDSEGNVTYTL